MFRHNFGPDLDIWIEIWFHIILTFLADKKRFKRYGIFSYKHYSNYNGFLKKHWKTEIKREHN